MIGIIKVEMADITAEMADIGLIRARIEMVVGMEGAKIQERENGETVQVTKATKNQTTQDQNKVILAPHSPETTIEIHRATTQTLMARRRISDVSAGLVARRGTLASAITRGEDRPSTVMTRKLSSSLPPNPRFSSHLLQWSMRQLSRPLKTLARR